MNKLDKDYQSLLQDILDNGVEKKDRTGTGTISVFGRQIRHNMKDGFPLLTTKKMPFKTIVTELLWFLRGDTNIKYLVDNGCNIWNGDAYKNYFKKYEQDKTPGIVYYTDPLEYRPYTQEEFINKIKTDDKFANKWGELGPIYGAQWRGWFKPEYVMNSDSETTLQPVEIDQIRRLIADLTNNPDSRRLMVNAWNVGELDQMVLPPCHYGFQVYTRELSLVEMIKLAKYENEEEIIKNRKENINQISERLLKDNIPTRAISLMWNQRSVDTFLGLPFNIASYGLLLEIIAKVVNMVPEELIGNLGDVHLYSNHIEQAKEQIGRELTDEERTVIYSELGLTESQESRKERFLNKEKFEPNIPKRTREPFPLPKLVFNPIFLANLEHNSFDEAINGQIDFELEGYQSHPTIKAPLSN